LPVAEVCDDGLDNDCDGLTDSADTDDCGTCTPTENPEVSCSDGQDNDCDGLTDSADSDCQTGACLDPDQLALSHDHSGKKALQGVQSAEEAVTTGCGKCHARKQGNDLLSANHYSWNGNKELQVNNFCTIAMPNAHCIKCHAGFDRIYNDYPGSPLENNKSDCLVCHAQYYDRAVNPDHTTTGVITDEGLAKGVDNWEALSKTVGRKPHKALCLRCHAGAGGGNKQGDLGASLATATADLDVHMGGLCMECVDCHATVEHNIEGAGTQHPAGTTRFSCQKCHTTAEHASSDLNNHTDWLACQTCHIPVFAKADTTNNNWYYDMQGFTLTKDTNLTPVYKWWDGTSTENFDLLNDTVSTTPPTVLAGPVDAAKPNNPTNQTAIKAYPFYEHLGANPYDTTSDKIMPFYRKSTECGSIEAADGGNRNRDLAYWNCAISNAVADWVAAGYSMSYTTDSVGFAETVMYLNLNHEVTKANALNCSDCHGTATPPAHNGSWTGWGDLGY
jgi:hypothetical protein